MKDELRKQRLELLSRDFPVYLDKFDRNCPFSSYQRDCHISTIELRRVTGSVKGAIDSNLFLEQLRKTLKAWRIGTRGTQLVDIGVFTDRLKQNEKAIADLDGLSIEDEGLDINSIITKLWSIISDLSIVTNSRHEPVNAPIVSGTKTLLHFLPDLIPPMDRKYTQAFYGWHNPEFQYHQEYCFRYIYGSMAEVARNAKPSRYVGQSWRTCTAKLLDSALIGFCLFHGIENMP